MSQYIVSARKYRPQNFDEVIGQKHISQTLKKALESNKLAHAFLFCGPRGVGKTSCARILAKVINCENPVQHSIACEECNSCLGFQKNASFNIFELDAASHNSVENIRDLNNQVRFQPQQGRYKVFIIDEVHMLSPQAFNAFLKTLEEPPPHAIFILATTEKHKIIPTILSRCQIFDFKRIQIADIVNQLNYISEKEKITVEEDALHVIASKSDGAMRDALSMFDRILSSTGRNSLSYQDVIGNLNILDYDVYFNAVDACLQEDLPTLFHILNDVLQRGFEPDHFALGLAGHFRNLLFSKDPKTLAIMESSQDLKKKYAQQAFLCTKQLLINGLSILNEADVQYQRAANKRLHIEIALSRLCYIHRIFKTGSIATEKKTEVKKDSLRPDPVKKEPQKKPDLPEAKPIAQIPTEDANSKQEIKKEIAAAANGNLSKPNLQNTPSINQIDHLISLAKEKIEATKNLDIPFTVEKVQEIWDEYILTVVSPSAKTMLKRTILEINDKTLLVKVGSQVAKEMILQESPLFHEIREKLHIPEMDLKLQLSPELFPDQEQIVPKKYLSAKEKYDLMVESNPMVSKLVQTFDLKLETD